MRERNQDSIEIGMDRIKNRRLTLPLSSSLGLTVGECVPFYFCPRSVMLYMAHKSNSSDLTYRGGQEPIVHLVADLNEAVNWAQQHNLRWAFTTSNAGAYYFEDYTDLNDLDKIDWEAVQANQWYDHDVKEKKQAEFLMEQCFAWELVEKIGVYSYHQYEQLINMHGIQPKRLRIEIQKSWYY
jgi:hypothetical protein